MTPDQLPPGTHLTTPRRGYVHHGLYVGEGRVIHYAGLGRRLRRGPVEEVSLEAFAGGKPWQVKPVPAPAFAGAHAVERARSRLGENDYSVFSNNCEHFVEWALNGTPRSAQVERLVGQLRQLVSVWRPLAGTRLAAR